MEKVEGLKPPDPRAFEGLLKKEPHGARNIECFLCHGFGYWIDTPNAYGPGKHFLIECSDCRGAGYVWDKVDHVHNWKHVRKISNCYNKYTCTICGQVQDIDSGD
jgi:hypothetical protein